MNKYESLDIETVWDEDIAIVLKLRFCTVQNGKKLYGFKKLN